MVAPLSKRQPTFDRRLEDLARAVGRVNERVTVIEQTPSGSADRQVFVQDTQPAMVAGKPWVWWKTIGGALSDYFVYDGVL